MVRGPLFESQLLLTSLLQRNLEFLLVRDKMCNAEINTDLTAKLTHWTNSGIVHNKYGVVLLIFVRLTSKGKTIAWQSK